MMEMQQSPQLDTPAEMQAPVVGRVIETARQQVQPQKKKGVFWAVTASYLLSLGSGVLTAIIINLLFGSPYNDALIPVNETLWKVGIPLSIIVTFFLGLVLPFFFAKRKRLRTMFYTMFALVITLIALVILGLSQVSPEQFFNSLVLE